MQNVVAVRLIVEKILNVNVKKIWNVNVNYVKVNGVQNNRSRSLGQCTCQVWRSGRCVMQGMMVVVEL